MADHGFMQQQTPAAGADVNAAADPREARQLEEEFFSVEGRPPDYSDLAGRVDAIRLLLAESTALLRSEYAKDAGPLLDEAFTQMLELHLKRLKG
jgi:hypothetical protein